MPPGSQEWRHGRRRWGGRWAGRWGDERPRWWPEGEPWPPPPEAWRLMRRRFARRAAAALVTILLVFVLVAAGIVWLISRVAGSAPLGVLGAIAATVLVAVLARRVLHSVRMAAAPVAELIEAAGRVEAGELGIQVAERGPREVRSLSRSFNAMSARLAHTEDQRRSLLADVSHELRTPLTIIQGNVEAMLDGLYPADREHLERIGAEARHLERLVEDLRTLSMADAGALALQREAIDLGAVAREVAAGFAAAAQAGGVALAVSGGDSIAEIELDPQRVRQVITNLVANALHHTPIGGRITVAVEGRPDAALLSVTDTGAGMTADEVNHAFDRFWRTDASAGAGLGLAIVKDLVAAHGGHAEIRSAPGAGTTVTCRFPRQGSSATAR